ncbi:phospholipid carrier-dependent glycosyltransferase [Curtobacterium herbarum]|uniref:Glycosyltransferase RgtA/B/C/D-like domain-containing protein n=1 Tax=Curtobacterium herbarum TaxID=150122 RepID=A0ABN1ZGW4_9MICO|nr:phospholipid carrier-dependent glycosyltransferase [Curtobacterium herbarum]MBM7474980.1 hypothetical protein [Curtobacterium herbarum]MCS6545623.1 phospholipid carrier-dependent glycosyltransferase [Curtobacterium herbarum]
MSGRTVDATRAGRSAERGDRTLVTRLRALAALGHWGVLLAHPWVFRTAMIVFVVFGVLFAVVLHYPIVDGNGTVPYVGTIAPDEHRHIANVLFYAHRSITAGPIIDSVPTRDLAMGEVLRFPSYFYYYVMSFPVKVMINEALPYSWIVVFLRLVNLVAGLLGLVVARRLLKATGFSESIAVLSVVLLAFTGRYMWQSAAVSYDPAAMTLFLLCLYFCGRFIHAPSPATLAKAVVVGGWAIIGKYTFVPFVVVAIVVAVVMVAQRDGLRGVVDVRHALSSFRDGVRRRTVGTIAWVLAFVVAAAIIVERFGVNLIVYRQFNPDCDKLHTHQQCLTFDIYTRNYNAERNHDLAVLSGTPQTPFDLLEFAGRWCTTYFQSIFFYRDRNSTWAVQPVVALLGALVFVAACIAVLLTLRSILRTRGFVWAVAVAGVYVAAMFVFNLQTFLRLDNDFAFSGRYLLPVLPLIYAVAIVAAIAFWRSLPSGWRQVAVVPVVVVVLVVLVLYSAPVAFFTYARDPSWYTDTALRLLPHWLTGAGSGA